MPVWENGASSPAYLALSQSIRSAWRRKSAPCCISQDREMQPPIPALEKLLSREGIRGPCIRNIS